MKLESATRRSALVTGSGGFVGPYVVAELRSRGYSVWTLDRAGRNHGGERTLACDLNDETGVRDALHKAKPDVIVHLAAQSSVPESFREPVATLRNNVLGAATLLYSASELAQRPRVLVAGSSEEYGRVGPEQLPLTEETPLAPVSPYGVGKAAQSLLALSLYRSVGLHVVVLRPFNHIGPGQTDRFVVPSFARQIARIEAGLDEQALRVGNLDSRRDFTDVRDIARAYALAAEFAEPGETFNLGSGVSVPIQWVLEQLLAMSGVEIVVESDPARMTPSDIPDLRADASKFAAAAGWRPQIALEQSLREVLEYERHRAAQDPGASP
ncbi:MAG: GDP-mannose 4,6-dehydratase [Chloroflexia bacterium]